MRPLVINFEAITAIAAAVEKARARPISRKTLERFGQKQSIREAAKPLALSDRPKDLDRPPSVFVKLPVGYMAAISFEEQPAGLTRHLSISVDEPGKLPNSQAAEMIAAAFGFVFPPDMAWLEEFEPGHHAINFLQLVEEHNGA